MFANPYGEEPTNEFRVVSDEEHLINYSKWEKAEKKVIFKGFADTIYESVESNTVQINFRKNCCLIDYTENGLMKTKFINTINELAEATKGELEANIEI